jgi:hypothetical protein
VGRKIGRAKRDARQLGYTWRDIKDVYGKSRQSAFTLLKRVGEQTERLGDVRPRCKVSSRQRG